MKLALGTVQFGLAYGIANETGKVGYSEARDILREARKAGIDTLDTAIAYGNSEQVLGEIGVNGWRVVSKLPELPAGCSDVPGWVERQVTESLQRLGIDRLHAVLLHRPDQLLDSRGDALYKALSDLRERGQTGKVGVSVYSPQQLDRLFEYMHFDLVQAPLSVLDRRIVESGWSERLRKMKVELHTRSAFLQGLLLMSSSDRPAKFDRWQPIWNEWDRWLQTTGLSPLEACLRYALSADGVDRVVVGVDSCDQMREILAAASGRLVDFPDWPASIEPDLINPSAWNSL